MKKYQRLSIVAAIMVKRKKGTSVTTTTVAKRDRNLFAITETEDLKQQRFMMKYHSKKLNSKRKIRRINRRQKSTDFTLVTAFLSKKIKRTFATKTTSKKKQHNLHVMTAAGDLQQQHFTKIKTNRKSRAKNKKVSIERRKTEKEQKIATFLEGRMMNIRP